MANENGKIAVCVVARFLVDYLVTIATWKTACADRELISTVDNCVFIYVAVLEFIIGMNLNYNSS